MDEQDAWPIKYFIHPIEWVFTWMGWIHYHPGHELGNRW